MDRRRLGVLGVLLAVGLLAAGPGLSFLAGPADGPPPTVETLTLVDDRSADGGSGSASAPTASDGSPFAFAVRSIEGCGTTCRTVTVTLRNRQEAGATGVVVEARLYAGRTTAEDARVWQGEESVGQLAAGASVTATKRVELGYVGASRVRARGGWVTVEVVVRSDGPTISFTRQRKVA